MFCKKNRLCLLIAFFSLFMVCSANAIEDIASIAVAANGSQADSMVSEKSGRAAHFLFFDGSGNFMKAEKNPFADAARKAGPKVAFFLQAKGVTLVVAGEFGTKMEGALNSYNIRYVLRTGVAHEVVQALIEEK
ncbi:MAG: NifB/NifX family molybdenum-iron cluster-binding protein [Thermodesulfobacteriota bacterium]|nr:NifB/NifX family molybdenum-iron cluster-binding protein [Thermodesulfobacteriota bacterium]